MTPVNLHEIEKSFGSVNALRGISFEVSAGELFGLIGPDGAGKTTLFRIMTSLLTPDKGSATILGFDVVRDYAEIRTRVGYMPGRFSLYQDLTVQENLEFFATIFGTTIEENYDLIRDIYSQIEPFKNRRAGKLSGGMKQKLALSCALIHAPAILFLDEPTTGVDPVSRKEFWEMLHRLKEKQITILVSTPYMDEASRCDRIALIQNGKIMGVDSPEKIKQLFSRPLLTISAANKAKLIRDLHEYPFAEAVFPFGETIHYTDKRKDITPDVLSDIENFLSQHNHIGIEVKQASPGVEDVFMQLMQQQN